MVNRRYILIGIIMLGLTLVWLSENQHAASPQVNISVSPTIQSSNYTGNDVYDAQTGLLSIANLLISFAGLLALALVNMWGINQF